MHPFTRLALFMFCAVALVSVRIDASPHAAAQTIPTDESQTLLLEQYVNAVRMSYGLPARTNDSRIRSIVRVWNVAPKDGEPTMLSAAITRSLRVGQFHAYDAYRSQFEEPGYHDAAEIVARWRDDALINPWIFQTPSYAYQGCAFWYEDDRTWAMCIFADLWGETDPTATSTPAPLRLPSTPGTSPLITRTPTPWRRW